MRVFTKKHPPGKITLAFSRARVERHEVVGGERCALIPFRDGAPDLNIGRDTPFTPAHRSDLLRRYVLCDGLPVTWRDGATAQTFFAIPDAQVAA